MIDLFYRNTTADSETVRMLMEEYASSMGLDLGYQNFDEELNKLPGKYAPPSGYLLLATDGGEAVGCVAIRKIDDEACEMKRLYVRPIYRGQEFGRILAESIIQKAVDLGYLSIRLDTLVSMREAVGLYKSLGFIEIGAYTYNPSDDVVFMELII